MAMLNNQRVYIYTHSIHIDCIYWIEYRQCWLWTFLLGLWHVFFVSLFVTFQSYILEPYACHSVACFGLTSPFVELAHILPCTLGYSFFFSIFFDFLFNYNHILQAVCVSNLFCSEKILMAQISDAEERVSQCCPVSISWRMARKMTMRHDSGG